FTQRRSRNSQPARFCRSQKGFMEDLSGVLHGASLEGVVERPDDNRLPEVTNGAVGLSGMLQPCCKALRIVLRIPTQKTGQASRNARLVMQVEHRRAQKTDRSMRRCRKTSATQHTSAAVRLQEGQLVIPANAVGHPCLPAEIQDVGAATENNMLRIDSLFDGWMLIRVGTSTNVGPTLEQRNLRSRPGKRRRGGQSGDASSYDNHIAVMRIAHTVIRLRRA